MRSRYTAYALATHNDAFGHSMLQYLLDTWHPGTSPGDIELAPTQWTGLEVLYGQDGVDAAVVEFIAHFKVNGKADKLHELSRFVRIQGVWKYIDGDILE
jgi:SEC-C motif domain protein